MKHYATMPSTLVLDGDEYSASLPSLPTSGEDRSAQYPFDRRLNGFKVRPGLEPRPTVCSPTLYQLSCRGYISLCMQMLLLLLYMKSEGGVGAQ